MIRRPEEPEAQAPDDGYDGPSKSARKRTAHAAQQLGLRLLELTPAELAALGLPERLVDALGEARRLTSRSATVRQRQYIGKLMRDLDPAEIESALAERDQRRALETRLQKLIESWRARLVLEGAPALAALAASHPRADRAVIAELAAGARDERGPESLRVAAARQLYRALRELLGSA